MLDINKVTDIVICPGDITDWPELSDSYVESANIEGRECTEEELEYITENYDNLQQEAVETIITNY